MLNDFSDQTVKPITRVSHSLVFIILLSTCTYITSKQYHTWGTLCSGLYDWLIHVRFQSHRYLPRLLMLSSLARARRLEHPAPVV